MTQEKRASALPGWVGLVLTLALFGLGLWLVIENARAGTALGVVAGSLLITASAFAIAGFFTLQPNQAAVLILFGSYIGTVRQDGWWYTNPFMTKKKVSLRIRNMQSEQLKVNDRDGNPVEIAAVTVWLVRDSAQSLFYVYEYEPFVGFEIESSFRHLAL
jgi:regulator of protease activity HflC (stomatin/prohibitin superfamily)